ncbi:rhomboid family intramembrane serine protease [Tahibacter harae]|uniref:Rhomboid family intramembrane serine protease n=1 Tax=Tahibacter harae TaxID=2963937 RepID=A0ABT1QT17_9GAMM|nr:rhomboid family intramembrane serine protease [Tahibacter harae]MCQ4165411.1 rhomboid family intramembrane serine protease [Tahibacter harae]
MFVTLILIGLTVAVSLAAFSNPRLQQQLVLWPPAVKRKNEYWRLFSYGLVHADGMHLFFNMFTLFFFGRAMELVLGQAMGPLGLPLLYLGGLLVSILPSYMKHQNDPNYYSLGASGAVSAVLFAYILVAPGSQILVFFLPMPAILFGVLYLAYTWYMDRQSRDNVNHSAHLWGAGFGLLFMALLEPRLVTRLLS